MRSWADSTKIVAHVCIKCSSRINIFSREEMSDPSSWISRETIVTRNWQNDFQSTSTYGSATVSISAGSNYRSSIRVIPNFRCGVQRNSRTRAKLSARIVADLLLFAIAIRMQPECSWPNATAVRRAIHSASHYSRRNLTRATLSGSL